MRFLRRSEPAADEERHFVDFVDLGDLRGDLPADAFAMDASGGGYEVVGESHYRDAIAAAAGGERREVVKFIAWAALVHEADNPYDGNAVALLIHGRKVGHLSRADAAAFAPVLDRIAAAGLVAYGRADTFGGWNRSPSDRGDYGITIYIGPPDAQAARLERRR